MGGKLTQAPATPELVERLRDERHVMQGDGLAALLATTSEAADALEAQQARIAELEVERDDLQRMYRHWAMIADQRLGASNRSLHRARDLQALADRYEKALKAEREWHDLRWSQALAIAPEESALGTTEAELALMRLVTLHRDRIEAIDQALSSSQGRHEGGEG